MGERRIRNPLARSRADSADSSSLPYGLVINPLVNFIGLSAGAPEFRRSPGCEDWVHSMEYRTFTAEPPRYQPDGCSERTNWKVRVLWLAASGRRSGATFYHAILSGSVGPARVAMWPVTPLVRLTMLPSPLRVQIRLSAFLFTEEQMRWGDSGSGTIARSAIGQKSRSSTHSPQTHSRSCPE